LTSNQEISAALVEKAVEAGRSEAEIEAALA